MNFYLLLKKIKINSKLINIIDQGVISIASFYINYLTALKFEKEIYGTLALILTVINYGNTMNSALSAQPFQILKNKLNKGFNFLLAGAIVSITFSILSGILVVYYLVNFYDVDNYILVLFYFYFVLFQIFDFKRRVLQSELKYKLLLFQDILVFGSKIIGVTFLAFYFEGYFKIQNILLLSIIFHLVGFYDTFPIKLPKLNLDFLFAEIKDLLGEGKLLFSYSLIFFFSSQVYLLILGSMRGVKEVGIAAALLIPFGLIRPLIGSAEGYLFSKFSSKTELYGFKKKYIKESLFFWLPILIFSLICILFPATMLNLIYGNKYIEYTEFFVLSSVSLILSTSITFMAIHSKLILKTKMLIKANLFSLIMIAPFGWFIIREYGLRGYYLITISNSILVLFFILFKKEKIDSIKK